MSSAGGATFQFNVDDHEFLDALSRASDKLDSIPRTAAMWNAGFGVAQAAVAGFVETLNQWVTAAGESELSMARMDAVLNATGYAAGRTASQMSDLASSIQRTTRFEDDAMMSGMAKLATFSAVTGETFERATRLSADLAEAGFGSVESAAVLLGKALQSPKEGMSALTRVGVTLTAQQKAWITRFAEVNDIAKAQAVILQAVQDQVGGVAESMGETSAGKIARLKNAFGDLEEALGSVVVNGITPFMESVQNEFDKSADGMIAKLDKIASATGKVSESWVGFGESMRNLPYVGKGLGAGWDTLTTSPFSRIMGFIDEYSPAGPDGESVMDAKSQDHFKKLSEDNRKYMAEQARLRQPLQEGLSVRGSMLAEAIKKAAEGAPKLRRDMEAAAEGIRKSLETPWDKALEKLKEINKLSGAGLLDDGTRFGAINALRTDLMKPYEDKFRDAAERELNARENVASLDKSIRETREGNGFQSSVESLAGMWSKIQTSAASTSRDAEQLAELVKTREEAARRWEEERRIQEDTRDAVRAMSQAQQHQHSVDMVG